LLLLCPAILFAQKKKVRHDPVYDKKPVHFGFTVGLNTMDFNVSLSNISLSEVGYWNYKQDDAGNRYYSMKRDTSVYYADVSRLSPGFNVGIVSNFKLNEYFDLRVLPGITFGQRKIAYHKNNKIFNDDNKIESSFLEFPMLAKYKSRRINNFRPYLIGGVNYRIDLAARKEYDDMDKVYLRLRRSDIYYEVGFGIDFYNRYFKFSTELKLAVGMLDVLIHDPAASNPHYVTAIDKLQSNLWLLSFHFE